MERCDELADFPHVRIFCGFLRQRLMYFAVNILQIRVYFYFYDNILYFIDLKSLLALKV